MEQIIQILMERDGNTRSEAEARCEKVRDMLGDCNYDPEESEEIFMSEFGLEMDYIGEFLLDISQNGRRYIRSSTSGDYSPSHPWDAPGMSIRDFI